MDHSTYTTLTRQTGLLREMAVVANNIANLSTTGYRAEGLIFAEHVASLGTGEGSLSMAYAVGRSISAQQGSLQQTDGTFDFAIEGEGFFLLATPEGEALTRAGRFMRNEVGELVSPSGHTLLDAGGASVFVPPDATSVALAQDGTLSVDGQPLAVVGLWQPVDPTNLSRQAGTVFAAPGGFEPADDGRIVQGFLEQSNVEAVTQIARMIEVQRAYELGQSFLDAEDQRVRDFLRTAGARNS